MLVTWAHGLDACHWPPRFQPLSTGPHHQAKIPSSPPGQPHPSQRPRKRSVSSRDLWHSSDVQCNSEPESVRCRGRRFRLLFTANKMVGVGLVSVRASVLWVCSCLQKRFVMLLSLDSAFRFTCAVPYQPPRSPSSFILDLRIVGEGIQTGVFESDIRIPNWPLFNLHKSVAAMSEPTYWIAATPFARTIIITPPSSLQFQLCRT
jgi:hypothetical protein